MVGKIFLYLACLSLPVDSFPFNIYGLGSPKPLALIFLGIFFMLNILNWRKIKFVTYDKLSFVVLFFSLLFTIARVRFQYNTSSQLSVFINSLIGFVVMYGSAILVIRMGNRELLEKVKVFIIIGYVIAFIIGVMQLITIRFNVTTFDNLYTYILRDVKYVQEGRIHFNFGEPSYIGSNIFLILVPMARYVSKKNKVKYISFVVTFYLLAFSSFSMQLILDTVIFGGILLIFNGGVSAIKKVIVFLVLSSSLLIGNELYIKNNYFNITSPFYYRIVSNVKQFSSHERGSKINDQSLEVRFSLAKCAFRGFLKKPILGNGLGYFNISFKEYIDEVNPYWIESDELMKIHEQDYAYSYMFYFNMLNESGLLGIIFLILFFKPLLKSKKEDRAYVVMACYFLLQGNMFGNLFVLCIFAKEKYFNNEEFFNESYDVNPRI